MRLLPDLIHLFFFSLTIAFDALQSLPRLNRVVAFSVPSNRVAMAGGLMNSRMKLVTAVAAIGFCANVAHADKPKGYDIKISVNSQVAGGEIPAGEYRLVVDQHSPKVVFRHLSSGDEIEASAKVQLGDEKFARTAIHSDNSSGATRILSIRLAGTKTSVVFE
jgi:hypothetical protein